MNYFTFENVTLKTDNIRRVMKIPSSPQGGPPYHDSGLVLFDDGQEITVSMAFAENLQKHLQSITS